ncbi:MAG TPA: N-acetylmuramoyl-L-alanine amidase [Vicinamibacteria bacterium]|nr:N-acetylmuramoyl-L-alanine amidase [Vicinamibacteria bacterium]
MTRWTVAAAFLLLPKSALAAPAEPLVLLTEGQRRELLVLPRGDVEMLSLESVISGFGVALRSASPGQSVTLVYQGREATLYNKKSLASVGGDLRLLSAPALHEAGQWLLPVDAVPRLLGPLLGVRSEWRAASRVLVLGNVGAPRVTVNTFVSGDVVRVVLSATEKVPFRVEQEQGKVAVKIARDLVDTTFTQERLTGGIVDWVQYLGGRDNVFAITPGKRFLDVQVQEQDGPPRLVLEFRAAASAVRKEGAPTPAPAPAPRGSPPPPSAVRTIVIDPGHGGDEVGAVGPGGTMEKDVTLAIARRLRASIQNSLGYQAFLTRERDEPLGLDDRTAVANNYKADLFVSIHCNASRAQGARGSEVYFLSYQASDDESRRLAQAEGAAVLAAAPEGSDLSLILWDMAQAAHLEDSSALASRIQEELAEITGSQGRGIKQAPFRVLVGAGMPAILVEVAFITNADEEKQLVSEAWQGRVAAALLRGISRFESDRSRAASLSGRAPGAQ